MDVIEVRGLRTRYGTKVAVDGIDLGVAEGEVLGVLGPNGAGKTTTVETVAGLRRPGEGTVRVAGFDPYRDRAAAVRTIGLQLQQGALQAKLTVREALTMYAAFYDDPMPATGLAERLLLADSLDTRYERLSGGQQQRLAVALALVGRPRVAVLDELSTGLDPQGRRHVWELVEEVNAAGTTVLLVTHLMEEAARLCDRVALVDAGRIVALDSPAALSSGTGLGTRMVFTPSAPLDPADLEDLPGVSGVELVDGEVRLRTTEDGVSHVLALLAGRRVTAHRLRVTDTGLDEAYLHLTTKETT